MAVGTQTVITGSRTSYGTNANLHVRDVEDKVMLLKPYQTPIEDFFFSDKFANEESVGERTKFEWFEDKFLPDSSTITTTGGGTTETDTVGNAYFINFDVIFIPSTGDRLLVTSGGGTTSITVKKIGAGNITATGGAVGCMRLTQAFAENAAKTSSITVQEVGKSGYCQIQKRMLSMTGREQALSQYTGKDWAYQFPKILMEMKEAMERTWIYNPLAYDEGSGGSGRTYSSGFDGELVTNRISYSGTLDETEFDDGMKQIFDGGGSNVREVQCSSGALADINKFMKQRYSIVNETEIKEYGVLSTARKRPNVTTYLHPQGLMNICWNPQLKAIGTNTKYAGAILVFDPEKVKKRYCPPDEKGTRKYRIEKGIETPGDDSYDAQYLFDQGLQVMHEETQGWFFQSGT